MLAAAMCLLAACGAAALGLFDSMTGTNQTFALVEKYGTTMENAPSAETDGHTVTVRAILRSDTITRVIYDISGSKRSVNSWDRFKDAEGDTILRVQFLTNNQPSGHTDELPGSFKTVYNQLRQSGPIGKVPDENACRWYADFDLTENVASVSIYLLSERNGAEVIQVELPDPVAERELLLSDAPLMLPFGQDTISCKIQQVLITPFRVTLCGTHNSQMNSLLKADGNWNELVKLYDIHGEEIQIGKDGSLNTMSGSVGPDSFTIELDCYDLLDPAEVTEIEIDSIRYPLL